MGAKLSSAQNKSTSRRKLSGDDNSNRPKPRKSSYEQPSTIEDSINATYSDFVKQRFQNIEQVYTLIQPPLGKGAYGEVFKARHKETGILRAIKRLRKDRATNKELEEMKTEVEVMKQVDHPNVVKVIEYFNDKKYFYIVEEFCEGKELLDHIQTMDEVNEEICSSIMKQLLSAVSCCHKHNIAHRDLKPQNILLCKSHDRYLVKVIDFGNSCQFNPKKKMTDFTGTAHFLAPEVIIQKYDKKVDIWSCGVIMYILLCGYPPFAGNTIPETLRSIAFDHLEFPDPDWRCISEDAKNLVQKMMQKNPKDRIDAETALKHPWFSRDASPKANPDLIKSVLGRMKIYRNKLKLENAIWTFMINFFLTKDEASEILQLFRALDKDKDGMISKDELKNCNKLIAGKYLSNDEIEIIMHNLDIDNTGYINFSDFTAAVISKERVLSPERLARTFKIIDSVLIKI